MFQRLQRLRQLKFNNKKGRMTLAYKLLHDCLLILLVFFVFALIAEGILPGIISNHFGLYKIAILFMINVLAIFGAGKAAGVYAEVRINKKIAWPLLFMLALLIFNSLLKLNIFLNLFILIFIFVTSYFLIKTFQEK